jgi:acetyl esterase
MTTQTTRPNLGVLQHLGRLDPELRGVAAELDVLEFEVATLAVERDRLGTLSAARAASVDRAGMEITTLHIDGAAGEPLAIRTYRPAAASGALPFVVYAHGGGFVAGNLDTDHAYCADLARSAGCLIVAIDYRLAPESPCPAALDDVSAGFDYVIENARDVGADPDRIAVAGRDAGAALVASLAQRVFDAEGPRIRLQMLHDPMLDRDSTRTRREFQHTPGLSGRAMDRGWFHYLGGETVSGHPVPAYRPNLEGLPPAFISCAEIDPCRDEAIDYANRLLHAYVHTELHVFAAAFHGFDSAAANSSVAVEVRALHARTLRRAFAY